MVLDAPNMEWKMDPRINRMNVQSPPATKHSRVTKAIAREPNLEAAFQWWSDLTNIWTPIGWKDHLMRFNVFWDGMILAEPHLNQRSEKWKGLGAQVSFIPNYKPTSATRGPVFLRQDDGSILQGWNDSEVPVLWTEWFQDGVLLRQEVFAHIVCGGDVRRGDEPLFAWIRLSIRDICPALPIEKIHGFNVFLDGGHINATMNMRNNIVLRHDQQLYPRKLVADRNHYSSKEGFRVLETNGRVRLGIAPCQPCQQVLFETPTREKLRKGSYVTNRLYVGMPARKGVGVVLL